MSSVRARPVLVALLAILAIALAAATLNSAVATNEGFGAGEGGAGGEGEGPIPGGEGEGSFVPLGPPAQGFGGIDLPCYRFLTDSTFLAALAAVVLGICYALYRRGGILLPVGFLFAIGPPWMFVYVIFTACERSGGSGSLGGAGGAPAENASLFAGELIGGGQGGGAPVASVFLLGILGIALVAAVALLFQSTDDDVVEEEPEAVEPGAAEVAAIGRAAGRAADRIEDDVDAGNAVYQAWREMTGHLDVERPETSTPAEFAAAAVEAGMNREDVSELTGLFEEVRYGGADPTEEREERAVSALRRIESEYAEADG